MSGQLSQSPDELINQVHHNSVPVLRTDPQAYVVNDGTNDRVMMGGFGDGSYGLKVSQSGYDVKSAANSKLVMSSAFNMLKIVGTGTVTLTIPGTMVSDQVASTSVAHGLGVSPAFSAFITDGTAFGTSSNQILMMPFTARYIVAGTIRGFMYADCYTTASNIVFRYTNETTVTDTTGGFITFKYYLFQETAN